MLAIRRPFQLSTYGYLTSRANFAGFAKLGGVPENCFKEFVMRTLSGLVVMMGLSFGVTLAQQPQGGNPATQPGAAGQKQGANQPGQAQPTQPGRSGQPAQQAK